MWTATINNTTIDDRGLTVVVNFTDGTTNFSQSFNTQETPSDSWVQDEVSTTLTMLNAMTTYADTLQAGDSVGQ